MVELEPDVVDDLLVVDERLLVETVPLIAEELLLEEELLVEEVLLIFAVVVSVDEAEAVLLAELDELVVSPVLVLAQGSDPFNFEVR